jgi:hypothetical protein
VLCFEKLMFAFAALGRQSKGSESEPSTMPVIIHSHEIHPFLPSLGSPLAIDRSRAEQQDIRPLDIAIINLMADKGVVTLSERRRKAGLPCDTSSGPDDLAPRGHRRGAEHTVRLS